MIEDEDRGGQGQSLTEFGALVRTLAVKRGVVHQTQLATLLTEAASEENRGEKVSLQRLRPWLYGVHTPPKWLPGVIADALNLSNTEQMELAMAYTYGTRRKVPQI